MAAVRQDDADRERDLRFMELALEQAERAFRADEVPVGAVLVGDGEVLAAAHNRVRADVDPTAHAEVLAIRAAAARLGVPRLPETVLYTTVEPCFMCAGALVHARIARVVWSVRDTKFGGCVSLGSVLTDPRGNHRAEVCEGLLAERSAELLRRFFRAKRG